MDVRLSLNQSVDFGAVFQGCPAEQKGLVFYDYTGLLDKSTLTVHLEGPSSL